MARFTARTGDEMPAVLGVSLSEKFVGAVTGRAAKDDGLAAGVIGESQGKGPGVFGRAPRDAGVIGYHGDPALNETTVANDAGRAGVFGASENGAGVLGYARDPGSPAVYAFGGLLAVPLGRPYAGEFRGDVKVTGDIMLSGADCAEHFDIAQDGADEAAVTAGTVVVIGDGGVLWSSREPYDRRVAGVVAGAGTYRPGIILDSAEPHPGRVPISLVGKVFCKADANYGAIAVGDLLTTSATPGHAMRATDPGRSFGAVIGKALGPLATGSGLIPILVGLG